MDLHGGEVPDAVELKGDLHVAAGSALVAPAHVVVARPDVVLVGLREVVQPRHPVRQLAQAFCHAGVCEGGKGTVTFASPTNLPPPSTPADSSSQPLGNSGGGVCSA